MRNPSGAVTVIVLTLPFTSHLPSHTGQTPPALALTRASAWDGSGSAASAATSTMSFFIRAPSPNF
jgi:hypothetical protein